MCGIAGLLLTNPRDDLQSLLSGLGRRLAHRGPDGQGFLEWSEATGAAIGQHPRGVPNCRAALVHRRLAIFDPTPASAQPMSSPDGTLHLVFNGAIYNYIELRGELESLGHRFRTRGDTEVLLMALVQWGPDALSRLVGMFAFGLLDTRRRQLTLARDPLGIKPLYYTRTAAVLAFASEIGPLLELPGVDRQVHPQRLFAYLRFGLTDDGAATMLRDVAQVEAGSVMQFAWDDPAAPTTRAYWRPEVARRTDLSFDDAAERLRELWLDSIRLHLRSDVPIGAALSGGIDSSAIVCSMRSVAGPDAPLHAVSYLADQPRVNEERYARLAADAAGAQLHPVHATPQELAADLDALIDSQDEPFGSTSIYAQRRVFQAAHQQGIKVMLDGQGADELLGGYRYFIANRAATLLRRGRWLQAARLLRHAARLPESGTAPAALLHALGLLLPPRLRAPALRATGRGLVPDWLSADWLVAHAVVPRVPRQARGPSFLSEQLWHSLRETSLPALLRYEDRNAMAFGIESRVPFLTTALVEFVLSLPEEYIVAPDGTSKRLLRRALRGLVPEAILARRDKIGFATPEQSWLAALRPWVENVLRSETAAAIGILRPDVMWEHWQAMLAGRQPFDFRFWRWVNLIRWVERRGVTAD